VKLLRRQRGVAVITALLLTTLAVTIVASLFWQQQVQVRSMENQRLQLQTKWILRGALDWARLVLRQDGQDNQQWTALDAVWNTPLAETRLDDYVERERVQGETFDATLSGKISDATARYNLRNLANGTKPDVKHMRIYARLLQSLQIDPVLAVRTAQAVASSALPEPPTGDNPQPAPPPATLPVELARVEDLLSIPGYTAQMVEKLRDFVIVLPEQTPVNVNTAPPEVIAALVKDYAVTTAQSLVARRKAAYYRKIEDFTEQLYGAEVEEGVAVVKSEYFLVTSRVRLDRAALDAQALVARGTKPPFLTTVLWIRQN
jgi:general secretion pathway protein K